MAILLTNALLADIDPLRVESGCLRIDNGLITARGPQVDAGANDEVVDCGGALVLPGMVNGHTHLYSALAVGMPPPAEAPQNFLEILQRVWWKLDRALDRDAIEMSARVGALTALQHGTTTLIDHHASPNCIAGSLEAVEEGLAALGLRGVLCYETTDRHGHDDSLAGIDENRRYLQRCAEQGGGHFAALVGAHASFTLEDNSMRALADLVGKFDSGVHIHVAEDGEDCVDALLREPFCGPVERLDHYGLLNDRAILAHCTRLVDDDGHAALGGLARIIESGCRVAHNARSNMNNSVGYARTARLADCMQLGTDGIGADMFAEAKSAWYISRHEEAGLGPDQVVGMLVASARRASQALGVTLGRLAVDAVADVVLTDYVPTTPLQSDNLAGHLVFGFDAGRICHVLTDGEWRLRDRQPVAIDLPAVRAQARDIASGIWRRMAEFPE